MPNVLFDPTGTLRMTLSPTMMRRCYCDYEQISLSFGWWKKPPWLGDTGTKSIGPSHAKAISHRSKTRLDGKIICSHTMSHSSLHLPLSLLSLSLSLSWWKAIYYSSYVSMADATRIRKWTCFPTSVEIERVRTYVRTSSLQDVDFLVSTCLYNVGECCLSLATVPFPSGEPCFGDGRRRQVLRTAKDHKRILKCATVNTRHCSPPLLPPSLQRVTFRRWHETSSTQNAGDEGRILRVEQWTLLCEIHL